MILKPETGVGSENRRHRQCASELVLRRSVSLPLQLACVVFMPLSPAFQLENPNPKLPLDPQLRLQTQTLTCLALWAAQPRSEGGTGGTQGGARARASGVGGGRARASCPGAPETRGRHASARRGQGEAQGRGGWRGWSVPPELLTPTRSNAARVLSVWQHTVRGLRNARSAASDWDEGKFMTSRMGAQRQRRARTRKTKPRLPRSSVQRQIA
eukprot:883486-Rhodomonas_salina.3